MSKIKYFDIPATVGIQGGFRQFSLTIEMRVLKHIFALDDKGTTLERSQRDINHARVQKLKSYVRENIDKKTPYIIPTLTGNIDGAAEFTPFEGYPGVGILRISRGASIRFFDGQHRAVSITEVLSQQPRFKETVSLLLTENLPRLVRQQFFSDINSTATKVSAAQNKAYNQRDSRNLLALHVAESVFDIGGYIDYENNVVTGSNTSIFSFKALYDCLCRMFRLGTRSTIDESMMKDATTVMKAWAQVMKWGIIGAGRDAPKYRQQNIGTHAVMLNAIGLATSYLLSRYKADQVAEILQNTDIKYRETFGHVHWENRCVDQVSWKMITDTKAVKLTASKLLQILGIVLPDELKSLETEYFNVSPDSFLTEDNVGGEWVFSEDKEEPWSVDEWGDKVLKVYNSAGIERPDRDSDIHTISMVLSEAEKKEPLPFTHSEILEKLEQALKINPSDCVFRLGMQRSGFIRTGFHM
ncbi:DGQHR domain-containing protein [Klebsiella oxytoca]|uniref:DGQHR domain-containing protein n=1 Tax=Klebsiella oxytoca TaxID=571 RepID=UPI0034D25C45